eukprot:TRINITY_DN4571_c0_g2_i1.p1 TRINITY_DN4571_c0_g2~~TRINITY_DN4571_c0_g2_i1.p1  ORF type:complete len:155 (-),score=36.86 TRINITY_DN4571_c0_g2_i1:71-535(-)
MEWNIKECPEHLYRVFKQIFPGIKIEENGLRIVPVWQKSTEDMSGFSEKVEEEREILSKKFLEWGTEKCKQLTKEGHWADLIDPSSGIPYLGERGSTIFMETDDAVCGMGIEVVDLGCCKAVCHKSYGFHAFLSTLFTAAPLSLVQQILLDKKD